MIANRLIDAQIWARLLQRDCQTTSGTLRVEGFSPKAIDSEKHFPMVPKRKKRIRAK
jgi:hypothetical protein